MFAPTLREDPSEAEAPSHRLLVRAGFIRQLAAGIYTSLPLGLRSMRKIEAIVRQVYGADGAVFLQTARDKIARYARDGLDRPRSC